MLYFTWKLEFFFGYGAVSRSFDLEVWNVLELQLVTVSNSWRFVTFYISALEILYLLQQ